MQRINFLWLGPAPLNTTLRLPRRLQTLLVQLNDEAIATVESFSPTGLLIGRGGQIRTDDPLLPKQMRYQAALRPDSLQSYLTANFRLVRYAHKGEPGLWGTGA